MKKSQFMASKIGGGLIHGIDLYSGKYGTYRRDAAINKNNPNNPFSINHGRCSGLMVSVLDSGLGGRVQALANALRCVLGQDT